MATENRTWAYGNFSIGDINVYVHGDVRGNIKGDLPELKISCISNVRYDWATMALSSQEIAKASRSCELLMEDMIREMQDSGVANLGRFNLTASQLSAVAHAIKTIDYYQLSDDESAIVEAIQDAGYEFSEIFTGERVSKNYIGDGILRILGIVPTVIAFVGETVWGAGTTVVGLAEFVTGETETLDRGIGLLLKAGSGLIIGTVNSVIIGPIEATVIAGGDAIFFSGK